MILVIALSTTTLNANKQFNKTDNHNKATDLAEMGITYYQSLLNNLIPQAEAAATSTLLNLNAVGNFGNVATDNTIMLNYNTNFCQEFKTRYAAITESNFITVEGDNKYKISPLEAVCSNSGPISVSVVSTGKTASDQVTIKGNFTIQQLANNQSNTISKPDPVIPISNILDFKLKGIDEITTDLTNLVGSILTGNSTLSLTSSAKIQNLILKGSSLLIVQGDAVVDNLYINGNSRLLVFGDVYLKDPLGTLNGNSFDVCILGNVYYNNNLNPLPSTYNLNNQCKQGHWGIDPNNGINVDYTYTPTQ